MITLEQMRQMVQSLCKQHGYYVSEINGKIYPLSKFDTSKERLIFQIVTYRTGITSQRIKSKLRFRDVCDARFMLLNILRENYPEMSLKEMGRLVGNRDHATVINSLKQHEAQIAFNASYRETYDAIVSDLLWLL